MAPSAGLWVSILVVALSGCVDAAVGPAGQPAASAAPSLSCADPCVTLLDGDAGDAFEPMIAVNPSDPLHLVAGTSEVTYDSAGFYHRWNKASVSHDGGKSWTTTRIPGGPSAGPSHPLFRATDMGDAVVAILPDGTVLFVGLALNFVLHGNFQPGGALTAYDLYVARSRDGGLTYPEVSIVASGRGVAAFTSARLEAAAAWEAHDKPWIAASRDGGTLLLSWTDIQFPPLDAPQDVGRGDIVFSTSTDGGKTWSAKALAVKGDSFGGASPQIAADGTFHVAFLSYRSGGIFLATSRDGGARWDVQTLAAEAAFDFPTLRIASSAVDGGPSRLLVLYAAPADGERRVRVPVLIRSDDGGKTWSEPVPLDAPGGPGQILPALDVDSLGRAYASFYHARDDKGAVLDYRVVRLEGDAVSTPVVVDPEVAGPVYWLGHYTGIVALPNGAFPVWVSAGKSGADLVGARVGLSA